MSRARESWDPSVRAELEEEGRVMINALREFLGLAPLYGADPRGPGAAQQPTTFSAPWLQQGTSRE
jgi:hypothetical protein